MPRPHDPQQCARVRRARWVRRRRTVAQRAQVRGGERGGDRTPHSAGGHWVLASATPSSRPWRLARYNRVSHSDQTRERAGVSDRGEGRGGHERMRCAIGAKPTKEISQVQD